MNNYHTHTRHCRHALGSEEEMIQAAIKSGFEEIGVSDHVPLPFFRWHLVKALPHTMTDFHSLLSWGKAFIKNGPGIRMPYREKKVYLNQLQILQLKYGNQIQIYKGFECEYFEDYLPYYQKLLANQEVDYLILGHHFHQYSISRNYYGRSFISLKDLRVYIDEAIEAMRTGLFTYFAHPDLFFVGLHQWDAVVEKEVRRLIEAAKNYDMILEVNGGGLSRKMIEINGEKMFPYPNPFFWDIVAEIGCRTIIGLDAHSPQELDSMMYNRLMIFCQEHHLMPLVSLDIN